MNNNVAKTRSSLLGYEWGWIIATALVLSSLAATPAWAHKASVFAAVQGKMISGEAYFRDGTPLRNAKVTAFDPDGQPLAEAQTDAQGKFSLPIARRCNHRLVVDAGDGHAAEYTVRVEEIPADLDGEKPGTVASAAPPADPAGQIDEKPRASRSVPSSDTPAARSGRDASTVSPASDAVAELRGEIAALQTQLVQLRRDLAAREDRARWSDVLGGIGYILGLMGLAFYFLGVLSRNRRNAPLLDPPRARPVTQADVPP